MQPRDFFQPSRRQNGEPNNVGRRKAQASVVALEIGDDTLFLCRGDSSLSALGLANHLVIPQFLASVAQRREVVGRLERNACRLQHLAQPGEVVSDGGRTGAFNALRLGMVQIAPDGEAVGGDARNWIALDPREVVRLGPASACLFPTSQTYQSISRWTVSCLSIGSSRARLGPNGDLSLAQGQSNYREFGGSRRQDLRQVLRLDQELPDQGKRRSADKQPGRC